MKEGRPSQTAALVCAARAIAHAQADVPGFSDPTALALLPDDGRARVERFLAGAPTNGLRARLEREFMARRTHMMAVRTVAIDGAIRAAPAPQLVILGAGLDGRAWRMPELADAVVFEVDHPDTQRDKRARAAALPRVTRDVRFVPVDFTRDSLDDRLAAAGHDPASATTWIWEGVVMYLTRPEIEATLAVIARRSTPGSRLVVAYAAPGAVMPLLKMVVRRYGEPFRSVLTAADMKTMLGAHGLDVAWDDDVPTLARRLSPAVGDATSALKHIRIVVAARAVARPGDGLCP